MYHWIAGTDGDDYSKDMKKIMKLENDLHSAYYQIRQKDEEIKKLKARIEHLIWVSDPTGGPKP